MSLASSSDDCGSGRIQDGELRSQATPEPSEDGSAEAVDSIFGSGLDASAKVHAGGAHAGCPTAVFLECPSFERAVRGCRWVGAIMDEVARHYDVDLCVLTWRAGGRLLFTADPAAGVFHVPLRPLCEECPYQLFNHTIRRELPIIISDVEQDDMYGRVDPAPFATSIRFYAAAPVLRAPGAYAGTLCVVDSRRPRDDFFLSDAAFLGEKAAELMEAVRDFHRAKGWR